MTNLRRVPVPFTLTCLLAVGLLTMSGCCQCKSEPGSDDTKTAGTNVAGPDDPGLRYPPPGSDGKTDDPKLTAQRIAKSQGRVGLSTDADQASHHLAEYHDKTGKPLKAGPNGGTLVKLPGVPYMAECILNRDAGTFTVNLLDAQAKPAGSEQSRLLLDLYWDETANPFDEEGFPEARVRLLAKKADGDKIATSFSGTERDLARRPGTFVFKLKHVTVAGKEVETAVYKFPQGVPVSAKASTRTGVTQ